MAAPRSWLLSLAAVTAVAACASSPTGPSGDAAVAVPSARSPVVGSARASASPRAALRHRHRHRHRHRPKPAGPSALVTRVVDGDTIYVSIGGRSVDLRLIGVNTPETVAPGTPVQCYGEAASRFTHSRLTGRHVRLTYDVERRDRYGRTLAYVWLGGRMFNKVLVVRGFATAYPYAPNTRYAPMFAAAERSARQHHRGLWKACAHGGGGHGSSRRCDPSYPAVCIPPPPPDLDCADIRFRNFKVVGRDPDNFDGDHNGIGCET